MAQSVKHLTLDFGSGHDLTVRDIEPHVGLCADLKEPAWDSLSLFLCPSPAHTVFVETNKQKKFKKKKKKIPADHRKVARTKPSTWLTQ